MRIKNYIKIAYKKLNSIYSKLFLSQLLIIILLATMIILFTLQNIEAFYFNNIKKTLFQEAALIEEQIREQIDNKEFTQLDRYVKKIGVKTDVRITIILNSGKVIADSEYDVTKMENHKDRLEVKEGLKGNSVYKRRYSDTLDKYMQYYTVPLHCIEGISVLRLSVFIEDINESLKEFQEKVLSISFFVIIVGLILSYVFSNKITSPLAEVVNSAKLMIKGDYTKKVFINSNDEIGLLADTYNTLSSEIGKLVTYLKNQEEFQRNIIENIDEGIAIIAANDEIIFANTVFDNFWDRNNNIGFKIWEIIKSDVILNMFNKAKKNLNKVADTIKFDNKTYFAMVKYLKKSSSCIIVIRDLTDYHNLIQMKKDFVTNASHELKTPLTSIKGFIETIDEEDNKDQIMYYVEIIKRQADRLVNIVNDLVLLGSLENSNSVIEKEDVEIYDVLNSSVKLFKKDAERKGLEIINNFDKLQYKKIKSDKYKLEQLFINILSNSIKYTDKGFIKISVKETEKDFIISIEDSGIGISEKDLDRIFERFYVVDKSRSRKSAGTGLGLSIVKHICNLLNISVKIESALNKGTKTFMRIHKKN